jgi:hypothetical protein
MIKKMININAINVEQNEEKILMNIIRLILLLIILINALIILIKLNQNSMDVLKLIKTEINMNVLNAIVITLLWSQI